ncbi:hypothetical protein ACI79G_10665 [Geodermatophilus sp. SYSU D00779]
MRSPREGTPLSELELVAGALMDGGVLREGTVVCWRSEQSGVEPTVGETVRLTVDGVGRLGLPALAEVEAQFVE